MLEDPQIATKRLQSGTSLGCVSKAQSTTGRQGTCACRRGCGANPQADLSQQGVNVAQLKLHMILYFLVVFEIVVFFCYRFICWFWR
ncbi:hypothetical protein OESDEN_15204 [Oesophagostomum dentatum]|uniref:Transmembrane protein n=1 Tax=Oesophagostomum dentatum TaxID=61180 RepID=A0A0B1SPG5_OESDE|nr:hypothetical protein OESDEN_15204 [Oesophagostomum dentatum]